MLGKENTFAVELSADSVVVIESDLRQKKIAKVMFLVLRVRRASIVAWNFVLAAHFPLAH